MRKHILFSIVFLNILLSYPISSIAIQGESDTFGEKLLWEFHGGDSYEQVLKKLNSIKQTNPDLKIGEFERGTRDGCVLTKFSEIAAIDNLKDINVITNQGFYNLSVQNLIIGGIKFAGSIGFSNAKINGVMGLPEGKSEPEIPSINQYGYLVYRYKNGMANTAIPLDAKTYILSEHISSIYLYLFPESPENVLQYRNNARQFVEQLVETLKSRGYEFKTSISQSDYAVLEAKKGNAVHFKLNGNWGAYSSMTISINYYAACDSDPIVKKILKIIPETKKASPANKGINF